MFNNNNMIYDNNDNLVAIFRTAYQNRLYKQGKQYLTGYDFIGKNLCMDNLIKIRDILLNNEE